MTTNLENLSNAELVALYNALPMVKPIKRFESVKAGINRIRAAQAKLSFDEAFLDKLIDKTTSNASDETKVETSDETTTSKTIAPHFLLGVTRPDEIAECWDGVDEFLYNKLWSVMSDVAPYAGETPPEPDLYATSNYWERFNDEEALRIGDERLRADARRRRSPRGPCGCA